MEHRLTSAPSSILRYRVRATFTFRSGASCLMATVHRCLSPGSNTRPRRGWQSFAVPFVRPISEGFAQKVNKRVVVAVSEPGAVATGQMFNCRKLSKLMRCLKRHLLQLRLRPVATASGSDTGEHFLCKVISEYVRRDVRIYGVAKKGGPNDQSSLPPWLRLPGRSDRCRGSPSRD